MKLSNEDEKIWNRIFKKIVEAIENDYETLEDERKTLKDRPEVERLRGFEIPYLLCYDIRYGCGNRNWWSKDLEPKDSGKDSSSTYSRFHHSTKCDQWPKRLSETEWKALIRK